MNTNHEELQKDLGKRIRAMRKERSMTQIDLAFKAELDYRHIQRLEAGKGNPKLETLYKLCVGLDIDIKELFDF